MARVRRGQASRELIVREDFNDADFMFLKRNFGLCGIKIKRAIMRPKRPSPVDPEKR